MTKSGFFFALGLASAVLGIVWPRMHPESRRMTMDYIVVQDVDATGTLTALRHTDQTLHVTLAGLSLEGAAGVQALRRAVKGKTVTLDCLHLSRTTFPCRVLLGRRDVGLELAQRGLARWSDADLREQDAKMQAQYKAASTRNATR